MEGLSAYEKQALREIDRFKHPAPTRVGEWWRRVSAPLEQATSRALDTGPGTQAVRIVQEVVEVINHGASWTVRRPAVLEAFRAAGHPSIGELADIAELALQDVDRVADLLATKYQALAVAEGAGSGLLGGVAIAADIGLVVGMALRAANEYATYYGFDINAPGERIFVIRMLAAASSSDRSERGEALEELASLAAELHSADGWRQPSTSTGKEVTAKLAEALAVRLLKGKLGQMIPLAGAVVASGYNAWFVGNVTDLSFQLYRERFLLRKYGDALLSSLED
ncbi:MAG: EcsC family protein [Deltaproteobacteria bacterium]|jgi:hypothetical protein|nr:EcsC family protein [Deltaproteobacteria bacterium]MBW2537621.1 EcsC family protein [Deltaproteobacteria bacterium]